MVRKTDHDSLTPNRVIALRWDGREEDIVWDASPKAGGSGFGVRMHPTGEKEYVFQPRWSKQVDKMANNGKAVASKSELIVIGSTSALELSVARDKLQGLRGHS